MTIAPIEKDLINKKILNKEEIKWINNYHRKVKKNLFKFMNLKEKIDLEKLVHLFNKSYHFSSVIKSILSSLALSIFFFVGFEFPITR